MHTVGCNLNNVEGSEPKTFPLQTSARLAGVSQL